MTFVSVLMDDAANVSEEKLKKYAERFLEDKEGLNHWYFVKGNMEEVMNFGLQG